MERQKITRRGSFDAAHRILNEKVKCWNLHGHRFDYELTFAFEEEEALGYAIDFKEIKRVACQFIDDYFDHGFIANPEDKVFIESCKSIGCKVWLMSLNRDNYCNPTAEHLAKELFMCVSMLLNTPNLRLESVRLYETPNCWVDANWNNITIDEQSNFTVSRGQLLKEYKDKKGVFEYDDRK